MDSLHRLEIIVLLLAVVLALTTVAQRILVSYPTFWAYRLMRLVAS